MVKNRLDQDDVSQSDTIDSLGRIQQITYVTESGLYDVIIRSDSEKAKPFRKWVTSEVLPSIRKTGSYAIPDFNNPIAAAWAWADAEDNGIIAEFGEIRTSFDKDGNPLFCLADVCDAIGISNPRNVKNRLDEDTVHQMDAVDSLGRMKEITFVTEDGLYDVIIRSDSEKAKPFRKWVTSVVLPSIRKTGSYSVPNFNNPIAAARAWTDAEEKRIIAESGEVRTFSDKDGNPLFCLADVCAAIGIKMPEWLKTDLIQGM